MPAWMLYASEALAFLSGFLFGLYAGSRRGAQRMRDPRVVERVAPQVEVPAETPPTGHGLMDQALREAPSRFAAARREASVLASYRCVVCGEGTVILCSACGVRVCLEHKAPERHDCPGAMPG